MAWLPVSQSFIYFYTVRKKIISLYSTGAVAEYQPPYYDMLPSDPTLEDVRNVVCNQGKRPLMQPSWYNDEVT